MVDHRTDQVKDYRQNIICAPILGRMKVKAELLGSLNSACSETINLRAPIFDQPHRGLPALLGKSGLKIFYTIIAMGYIHVVMKFTAPTTTTIFLCYKVPTLILILIRSQPISLF